MRQYQEKTLKKPKRAQTNKKSSSDMEESSGDESDKVHPIYQIINTGFEKSPEKPYPFILPVT